VLLKLGIGLKIFLLDFISLETSSYAGYLRAKPKKKSFLSSVRHLSTPIFRVIILELIVSEALIVCPDSANGFLNNKKSSCHVVLALLT
jgi:hypothetical protein